MNEDQILEQQLIGHEAMKLKPYFDCCGKPVAECRCPKKGKLTIGVGRNIEDNGISREEALQLLRNDIERTRMELTAAFPWFAGLGQTRQRVVIDMCFNLGLPRLRGFKNMLLALAVANFEAAADEMLNSAWAGQVGGRAVNLAKMMREG